MIINETMKVKTTIQAVPERFNYIEPVAKRFNAIVHIDYEKKYAYKTFIDMLGYEVEDFRFHLQDDAIVADNLENHLNHLCKFMGDKNIHALTLFNPKRQSMTEQMNKNKRIVSYNNYVGNIGIIFSKKFVEGMRSHVIHSSQTKDDDFFIQEVSDKTGMKIYAHLPNLVQHNMGLGSLLNHDGKRDQMVSNIFDNNFCKSI